MTSIDIHVIQSVPPSNINRDDNGSPKTAVYGGSRRARVSSQAWKRATREAYDQILDHKDLGHRTKRVAELIAEQIQDMRPETTADSAVGAAWEVLSALKLKEDKGKKASEGAPETQYLVFFSNSQIRRLAELAVANDLGKVAPKEAKAIAKAEHGVSLSLFGRMIADDPDLNVDAAVQVAHAISTHAVDSEFDFYTAVDDHNRDDESGAGMMGTIEFNSSTMYRYATISLEALHENLGDAEAAKRAVEAFLTGFVKSMPSGKQNTFGNGTLPHGIVVVARKGQGVSWVGAFEDAVAANGHGYVQASCESLAQHATDLADAYGEEPAASWVTTVGDKARPLQDLGVSVAFPELVTHVGDYVREHVSELA